MIYTKNGAVIENNDKDLECLYIRSGWVPYIAPIVNDIVSEEVVIEPEIANKKIYSEQELSTMKAGEIKSLATELGYTVTAIKQVDCIKQFMSQQK